jgi:hypothetical protein
MAVDLAHIVIAAAIGYFLFRTIRWIRHQSPLVGGIVTAGLLVRAFLGVSLFFISYADAPILRQLHFGDGFWTLAADARGYYQAALLAADRGLQSVDRAGASPFYVQVLALWMLLVGRGPAVGLYLNVCLYVTVMAVLVRMFQPFNQAIRDLPLIVAVLALSLSPVSVIHGTQTLKDELFTALIAMACVGALFALRGLAFADSCAHARRDGVAGVAILAAALYGIGGVRWYYSSLIWASFALTLGLFGTRQTLRALLWYVPAAFVTLVLLWFAYAAGAGPYYPGPRLSDVSRLTTPADLVNAVLRSVARARAGFVKSGGATNIVQLPTGEAELEICESCQDGMRRLIRIATVGVATVVVPISVLQAMSVAGFPGGRRLLPIADIDTLVLDVGTIALVILLYRRRRELGHHTPAVIFLLILSAVTTILLGYVVTNFGTLFRLRLMMAVPLWMLPLALSPSTSAVSSPASDARTMTPRRGASGVRPAGSADARETRRPRNPNRVAG